MKLLMIIVIYLMPFISWSQTDSNKAVCTLYGMTHDDSLNDYIKIIEKNGKVQGGFYYGEALQFDGKRFYYFRKLSILYGPQKEISLQSANMEIGYWPGKNSTMNSRSEKVNILKLPWYYEHPFQYFGEREGDVLRLTVLSQKHLFGRFEVLYFSKLTLQCSGEPELDF